MGPPEIRKQAHRTCMPRVACTGWLPSDFPPTLADTLAPLVESTSAQLAAQAAGLALAAACFGGGSAPADSKFGLPFRNSTSLEAHVRRETRDTRGDRRRTRACELSPSCQLA